MSNDETRVGRVRQLTEQVDNIIELLRSQRDQLQQRGMTLPSGALDNLQSLRKRIDVLSRQLTNTYVELRQLRALADTTALINSSLETEAVLNQVMDTVISLTGAERGYIVLKNRQTGEFDQFQVARGLDTAQLADQSGGRNELIVSKTIVNEVAQTGTPVLTDNASQDDRYRGQQSIVGFALRSILAVPLKVRDEVIGVVYCDNRVLAGLFQATDRDLLAAFANQAGVAIENARLFETARQQLAQLTEMRDLMDNIFDSIVNGVITLDNHGIINTCNAAAVAILRQDDAVIGHQLREVMPPLGNEFVSVLEQVWRDGMQRVVECYPVIQGEERTWNLIISLLRDAETGDSQGMALVLDDLTEQKLREAQLRELRRYLPGALVDNFASIEDVIGEEREITVIAADVRGFTTFSEQLQPEQVMQIINNYLSLASDAINLYEGIVDKYMGDAVTGLFNTQLNPQVDHPMRAVRAAMNLIYDLFALHEVMPEEQRLYYGVGIHTGSAFLGNVGSPERQEFAALGDANTIAKILEGNARAGEIIISEATYEMVKDHFDCEERMPEKTKGRTDIPRVYRVIKRKQGSKTGPLFIDPELADLLRDMGDS